MTISHYLAGDFGLITKVFRCSGYSHAESAWAISKSGWTMAKSLIGHLFNISLDGRCPLNMLDEHFLVPINTRFARVMYICGTERGQGDARLPGGEYRMPIVQSEG